MELKQIWGSIRGQIIENFTFSQIKGLAGASGLPTQRLAHLQQRSLPGKSASKSQLLDSIDIILNEQVDSERTMEFFIKEMIQVKPELTEIINERIQRFGWYLENGELCSTELRIDEGTTDFKQEIQSSLSNCFRRYRDRDYSGAITCICGAIDSLTEEVYGLKGLGNHRNDSYQKRVNKAFSSFKDEFNSEFNNIETIDDTELKQLWDNYKNSVNQAAYVLGLFRRKISDAHGANDCPRGFVQKALDCGTFILRCFSQYLK